MAFAQGLFAPSHEFKGFHHNVILMTRATGKEQATTSLKTNFLNLHHVESNKTFRRSYKESEKCEHAEFSRLKKRR